MRKKLQLMNVDKDGCYAVLELHIDHVGDFFRRLNRRIIHSPLGITNQTRPARNRDVPCVKDYTVFLNVTNQIASVVLFFDDAEDPAFINHYLQKLRRQYRVSTNFTYSQLIQWSNVSKDIYLLPSSIGMWPVDSLDIMTLWLSAKSTKSK